jgi:hypothetical protein
VISLASEILETKNSESDALTQSLIMSIGTGLLPKDLELFKELMVKYGF